VIVTRSHRLGLVLVGFVSLAAVAAARQAQAPAAPAEQTAGQKYKNVQVLKDMPLTQFSDTMVYMNAATGQTCEGCHVKTAAGEWQFDKDDKDHKTTARTMITMTQAINTQHFKGEQRVMCTTCHSGRREPLATTPLAQTMTPDQLAMAAARAAAPPLAPGQRPAPPSETVDQILDKYVAALGGREALAKVTSRTMKGTVTDRANHASPYTIEEKAPGAIRATTVLSPALSIVSAFDGKGGWVQAGKDGGEFTGVELAHLARTTELGLALNVKTQLSRLTVGRYEKIDGQDVISINGRSNPNVMETLYFDRTSGLLVRRVARLGTVMGQIPVQWDYSDYRVVDGVKMPFQIRETNWEAVNTAKFTEVKLNAPVDDARFRR
jgi:hypothetical protein